MNYSELDACNKRINELLDKLNKGYTLPPNPQRKTANMHPNNTETTIEKPFEDAEDLPLVLTADNIISRTERTVRLPLMKSFTTVNYCSLLSHGRLRRVFDWLECRPTEKERG